MKQIFFFSLACCLSILTISAQIRWGGRSGVSKISVSLLDEKRWQPVDWHGLAILEIKIASDLWLQPEIGLASRHSYYYSSGVSHSYEKHYELLQLETNLLCKYLLVEKKLKIFPFGGLATGYVVSGVVTSGGRFPSGWVANNHSMHLGFDFLEHNRFTVGPIFGLAFQYPLNHGSLVLDIRYSRYALGTYPGCDSCVSREDKFSLGAGYFFGAEN
jgi:hypothetical protein